MRSKAAFPDSIQSLLSYAKTPQEDYFLVFANAHILDVFGDVMSSKFLPANRKSIHRRYIKRDKMTNYNKGMLSLLLNLSRDTLVIKHLRANTLITQVFKIFLRLIYQVLLGHPVGFLMMFIASKKDLQKDGVLCTIYRLLCKEIVSKVFISFCSCRAWIYFSLITLSLKKVREQFIFINIGTIWSG